MSQVEKVDVLADLRGVVRIAKAASVGVTGNGPRIELAEQAIAAVSRLVAKADNAERVLRNAIAAGQIDSGYGAHAVDLRAALRPFTGERA